MKHFFLPDLDCRTRGESRQQIQILRFPRDQTCKANSSDIESIDDEIQMNVSF
jgi:hypothetical protein